MVAIAPTSYLQHHLDPLSQAITSFGGYHVVMGLIASGGQPHVYITGNGPDTLKKEMYMALSDKLREMASGNTPKLVSSEGVIL